MSVTYRLLHGVIGLGFAGHENEPEIAESLVRRIQAGDAQAEEDLVKRYSSGLLSLLRYRSNDPVLSDDLHQETLLLVIGKIREHKIGEPAKLAGYIRRVSRNLMIGAYRKRERLSETPPVASSLISPGSDPSAQLESNEESLVVRAVLAELKIPRDREILYRFYVAEEDKAQILSLFDIDALHFNRVLHRARQRFAQLWEKRQRATEAAAQRTATQVLMVLSFIPFCLAIVRLKSMDFL